ncbi:MAG TPA: MFS transporter [Chryseolinea sp.]|nr:MFS transporter [Chryseolinea sp.]
MDISQTSPSPANLIRARNATRFFFLVCGLGVASWAPLVPFAKIRLNLNDAELGILLLALGAGAIFTMPFTGILINRYGSRMIILISSLLIAVVLPSLLIASTAFSLGLLLFVFGCSAGAIDVAMNSQAVVIQNKIDKPIMSSFHGLFSVGGLMGSATPGLLMNEGLKPLYAIIAVSGLLLLITITQYRRLLPAADEPRHTGAVLALPRGPVLALGLMCFIVFLAEGALLDWSAVFLQFNRGFSPSFSGLGYAAFSIAMAVMRLTGDKIVAKVGTSKIVLYGGLVASAGFLLAVLVPMPFAALAGFVLVGIGAANIVPVFFSAAGRVPGIPPAIALPAITTMGYAGQLAGPALIGFVAEAVSLPFSLGLLSLFLFIVAVSFRSSK